MAIFFKNIKQYSLYIALLIFFMVNAAMVGHDFLLKKVLIISLLLIVIAFCFYKKDSFKKMVQYFIYTDDSHLIKKASGGISLLSWMLFALSVFFLNIGFVVSARWLVLSFIICVIISGVLTVYDLERGGNIIFSKLRLVFISGTSVLYFITSAFAASYFLQMSNMNISDSPLLELGWKSAFFAVYFFMLLQPISYGIFLWVADKLKGPQLMTLLGVVMLTSLMLFAMPRWAENFIVVVLDWTTNSEWYSSATCGSLNVNEPSERYFGFNSDKYTVYFSNRNGKWGFEELQCIKNDKNIDSLKRVPVSQSNMPKWFKD